MEAAKKMQNRSIRNIAIISHVDHGKTTLVDCLLRQSGTFRENQSVNERVMDSLDLEREKGITIKAKNASFRYGDYHINLIDTPGHADFGGEVERILNMVDGVLLLVDAAEGPQAQTRFVLRKALEHGAKPIVVINKIDREYARPHAVLDQAFDLFLGLGASDEQLDFSVIYASAKEGKAQRELDQPNDSFEPLFQSIIDDVPAPKIEQGSQFKMLVANLDYSDYLGRISLGKVLSGKVHVGDPLVCLRADGTRKHSKVSALFHFKGLQRVQIEEAEAGDIIGLTGIEEVRIGETLAGSDTCTAVPFVPIDPPTISMQVAVNDGPLAGRDGRFLTARHLWERLVRETRTNISLEVRDLDQPNLFEIVARGEMQIAVLVEQMRREGYELLISRPEVIFKRNEQGDLLEPFEQLYLDIPSESMGPIMENLASRRATVTTMNSEGDRMLLEATIPTRGLIGLESEVTNITRGLGVMSHLFKEYAPDCGPIASRNSGSMISIEDGEVTAYAIGLMQERGRIMVVPNDQVYKGMVVGEHAKEQDLPVNPCRAKKLTNMRSQGDGKAVQLHSPMLLTLEKALEFIASDEYVEATPHHLRLRKKILDENARKRASQSGPKRVVAEAG